MSTAIVELHDAKVTGMDAVGHKTAQRGFYVQAATLGEAYNAINDPMYKFFPDDSSLFFDRFEVKPNASGAGFTATVYLTNFKRDRYSIAPQNLNGVLRYFWDSRIATVELPAAVLEPRIITGPNNMTQTVMLWATEKVKVEEPRVRRVIKVRLDGVPLDRFDAIAYQHNHLHTFQGLKMQFIDGTVSQGDGTYVEFTYTWEFDQGTKVPDIDPASTPMYYFPQPTDIQTPGLIRDPYCILSVIPPANPQQLPATTVQLRPYADDPNGWQQLPGLVQ